MITLQRKHIKVKEERRLHPRLDFHCDATIRGISGVRKITDISLGGFFFELKTTKKIKMGQVVGTAINFPTERNDIKVKAKLINQSECGIGCQFVGISPGNKEAVRMCFETYKDTLPIL